MDVLICYARRCKFIYAYLSILGILSSLMAEKAIAQDTLQLPADTPPPVLPLPQEPAPVRPLPPLEDVLPPPQTSPPGSQLTPEQIPGTVVLKKIDVEGSTVFTEEELAEILEPYTLRPVTFVELLEVQRAITQLYVENGYITSGAFIPPQEIEDRVLRVRAIEGSVESIEITGLERLNSDYVRSRLKIATDAPLNREKLLNALQLLQLDPLIANLTAELDPGITPGNSILSVEIEEANVFNLQLAFDNNRAPSVGTDRFSVGLSQGNLFGFGDRFSLSYSTTEGSDAINDFTYTIPLNPQNGTFSFSYLHSDSEIIEEPFDDFNIESTRNSYQATYRQPLYQTPNQEFALGFTFTRDESEVEYEPFLDGEVEPFPSRGAEPDGQTKISALRFSQEYTSRDLSQVFALRSQFSFGIDVFDPTTSNIKNVPDSKFFTWRGQAQYLRLLSPETTLLLRLDTQLANDPLVPIEQFSIGGAFTVRGYRQDALLADNGIFASTELRTSLVRFSESSVLQLTPFVDVGHVWNTNDVNEFEDTLLSIGVGLRLLISDFLIARIDYGIPLLDNDDTDETLQENGIHFSIEANLF